MRAIMAATIFAPRNFCLILLSFLCFSSSFYNSVTSNGIILQSTSFGKSGHYFIYCRDRPSYSANRPITIWNKHGFMCLLLPPNDLTICVDIERNPGPLCSLLNNIIHSATNALTIHRPCSSAGLGCQQQQRQSVISFSRNQLLSFCHLGKLCCTPTLLMKLKSTGILRCRGKRSVRLTKARAMRVGLRIPVTISNRRHYGS